MRIQAPLLLVGVLYRPTWWRLLAGLAVFAAVPLLHPDWTLPWLKPLAGLLFMLYLAWRVRALPARPLLPAAQTGNG